MIHTHRTKKRKIANRIGAMVLAITMLASNLTALAVPQPRDSAKTDSAIAAQAEQAAARNGMRLWFKEPAKDWMSEATLIGNGYFGSVLFGGVEKDRIHINEKTLWTGGPSKSRPGYNFGNRATPASAESIRNSQAALEAEPINNSVGDISNMWGTAEGLGSYQDFGDIWVDFAPSGHRQSEVVGYERALDLNTGVATVSYQHAGAAYRREYFSSYPDKVQVYRFEANQQGLQSFDISMACAQSGASITADADTITMSGALNDNGMKYESQLRVFTDGGSYTATDDGKIQVRNADAVTIIMAAGTDYKNDYPTYRGEDPHAEIVASLTQAEETGYRALRERHIVDHYTLFSRVNLDLGGTPPNIPTDELVKSYRTGDFNLFLDMIQYQMGRYLTIAGSRAGSLPSNLQSLWGVGAMAWNGDYHFNENIQMNYWQVYSANLAECGIPLVEYVESLREPGRVTAGASHNVVSGPGEENGWIVHTQNNPFGMTAPSYNREWGWNMGGAPWILQNTYDHYRFTGDVDYLRSTIYPAMREQVKFWDAFLIESKKQGKPLLDSVTGNPVLDEHGIPIVTPRMVVSPSISAEQGPLSIGATYDQSLVWQLYKETIEASKVLGVDKDMRARWSEIVDGTPGKLTGAPGETIGLSPVQIGTDGQIKEWFDEGAIGKMSDGSKITWYNLNGGDKYRHLSHMLGLYPGNLINKDNPTNIAAAKVALEQRGFETATSFSKAQRAASWARTLDGNKAYRNIQALLTQDQRGVMNNLLSSVGADQGSTLAATPRLFQSEGNAGYTAAVSEMLLQSHLGYIQPLPALPDAWPVGSVQGLVARGNFVIDMQWAKQTLTEMTITAPIGGPCVVEYPGIANATIMNDAGKIVRSAKGVSDRISFETKPGEVYTITNIAGATKEVLEPPANVRAYRTGDAKIELTWNAADGAETYIIYRQKLKVIPSGQSKGSLYGEGYEKIAEVAGNTTEFTDTDLLAASKCSYMVAVRRALGDSSLCPPVMPQALDLAAAIAAAEVVQAQLDAAIPSGLKTELQVQIDAAKAMSDTTALTTRESACADLAELTEKCRWTLSLSQAIDPARQVLERATPGTRSWECPAALLNRLNDAEQTARALLDGGVDAYSAQSIKLFAQSLQEATVMVRGAIERLSVNIAPTSGSLKAGEQLTLTTSIDDLSLQLRYTLDGTDPTASSPLYEGPLIVTKAGSATINAQAFWGNAAVGMPATRQYQDGNLALNKPAKSSWKDYSGYEPGKAVDGNMSTAWSSKTTPPQTATTPGADIIIDLTQERLIDRVILTEYTGNGVCIRSFDLLVANAENGPWTKVYSGGEVAEKPYCDFTPVLARYVKFVTTEVRPNVAALTELEIYGATAEAEFTDKEVGLQLGKTTLHVGESVQLHVTAHNGAGAPVACDSITYHTDAPSDAVSWDGARLTLEKPCEPFMVWATCIIDGATYMTAKQNLRFEITNIALGKAASAAFERPGYPAGYALDGALASMWGTYGSSAELMPPNLWYQIDFGKSMQFDQVVLEEFASYVSSSSSMDTQTMTGFTLETSEDGVVWTTVFTLRKNESPDGYTLLPLDPSNGADYGPMANPDSPVNHAGTIDRDGNMLTAKHTVAFDVPVAAQYLKLTVTDVVPGGGKGGKANVSIHEFAVHNTTVAETLTADIPYATPASCTFSGSQEISLAAPDAGAVIHYTLDGSEPTAQSPIYELPITITDTTTLRTISVVPDCGDSAVSTFVYTKQAQPSKPEEPDTPVVLSAPTASPAAGSYDAMQTVSLYGGEGASIRYTLDGTDPSKTNGILYRGPVKLAADKTIRAVSYHADEITDIVEFAYSITLTNPPALIAAISLDSMTLKLDAGTSSKLTAMVLPAMQTQPDLQWHTSNSAVAQVDQNGTVRAVSQGSATIIATADSGQYASCVVFVDGTPYTGGGIGNTRYSIAVTQSPGGTISPSGATVDANASAAFTIKADAGYRIKDVLVDGQSIGAVSSYTFIRVTKNHTLLAEFAKLPAMPFTDVAANSWYYEAVSYAYENGLMNGTSAQSFTPNAATSRGMLVTILFRLAAEPAVETDGTQWYSQAQAWAMETELSDGSNMEGSITREQFVTMLHRYTVQRKLDVSAKGDAARFVDGNQVSAFAAEAMNWAIGTGLIAGKGNGALDPQGNATRAEAAMMLMRFCEDIAK